MPHRHIYEHKKGKNAYIIMQTETQHKKLY